MPGDLSLGNACQSGCGAEADGSIGVLLKRPVNPKGPDTTLKQLGQVFPTDLLELSGQAIGEVDLQMNRHGKSSRGPSYFATSRGENNTPIDERSQCPDWDPGFYP